MSTEEKNKINIYQIVGVKYTNKKFNGNHAIAPTWEFFAKVKSKRFSRFNWDTHGTLISMSCWNIPTDACAI